MVECGFMSNVKVNNQLKQYVYRRRVAFCILAGLSDTMKTGSYRNGKTEEYVYLQRMGGYESGKWYGKCPGCGEWNTMNEETPAVKSTGTKRSSGGYASRPLKRLSEITEDVERRISTGIHEFDRGAGRRYRTGQPGALRWRSGYR